jgi:iron complex outermembrane receptor protein
MTLDITDKRIKNRVTNLAIALVTGSVMQGAIAQDVSSYTLEEVVITAKKRAANMQDESVSVVAISSEKLGAGSIAVGDLQTLVPGLTLSTGQSPIVGLRGISSDAKLNTGDAAVAFHMDGVYISRPSAVKNGFYDLERVEVLRGPQGILYGRNTTAGSINVITTKPSFYRNSFIEAQMGNYDRRNIKGATNVTLSDDVLAARIAFNYDQRDSFQDTGEVSNEHSGFALDDFSFRVHTMYTPSEELSVLTTYEKSSRNGGAPTILPVPNRRPGKSIWDAPLSMVENVDEGNESVRLEVNYAMDWGQLTYVSGWLDHFSLLDSDFDGGTVMGQTVNERFTSEQYTHELRLSSDGNEKIDWLLGLYSFDEKSTRVADVRLSPGFHLAQNLPNFKSDSLAAFGNMTYHFSNSVRVIAGLRYSEDKKSEKDSTRVLTLGPNTIPTQGSAQGSWDATDWSMGLDWNFSDDHLIYAKASTGYKSGGFVDAISAVLVGLDDPTFNAEELMAYEVGHKSEFLDNRLRINSAAYWYDYTDQQILVFAGGGNIIENADSKISGFESDVIFGLTENTLINFSIAYTNAEMAAGTILFDGTNRTESEVGTYTDVSGNSPARVPELSYTLGVEHSFPLDDGATITAGFNYHWEDETDMREFGHTVDFQKAWHQTDARLTYKSSDELILVEAWAKNIEDPSDYEDAVKSQMFVTGVGGRHAWIRPPASYGLRLVKKFD